MKLLASVEKSRRQSIVSTPEKCLKFLLAFNVALAVMAIVAAVMPQSWLVWCIDKGGPDLSVGLLVSYLARALSAMFFLQGVLYLVFATDVRRYAEATQLNQWLEAYLQGEDDKDVVLIGDCNTKSMGAGGTQQSQTIGNLEVNGTFTCVSKRHPEYTTLQSQQRCDHAFLSSDFLDEYIEGSWDARREVADVYPGEYMRDISNHVAMTLRIQDEDNDSSSAGVWTGD